MGCIEEHKSDLEMLSAHVLLWIDIERSTERNMLDVYKWNDELALDCALNKEDMTDMTFDITDGFKLDIFFNTLLIEQRC